MHMWNDFIYSVGDMFQWSFQFYDQVQNLFNNFLILLGFFGFGYWMNVQHKLNKKSNVSFKAEENVGWYKEENKQLK